MSRRSAADQAGLSRLWGGIHISADDLKGRRTGAQCGRGAWALARQYFDGSIMQAPVALAIRTTTSGQCKLRCDTLRGFFYKLQSTPNLTQPFVDDQAGLTQAVDSSLVRLEDVSPPKRFYRVIRTSMP